MDRKMEVLEAEERNRLEEEEELDKLVLQNIYSEIMEEVMDVGGDQIVLPPKIKSRDRSHHKGTKGNKNKS
jgi:hypothetical protein